MYYAMSYRRLIFQLEPGLIRLRSVKATVLRCAEALIRRPGNVESTT